MKRNLLFITMVLLIVTIVLGIISTPEVATLCGIITLLSFWCFIIVPIKIPGKQILDEPYITHCPNRVGMCKASMCDDCTVSSATHCSIGYGIQCVNPNTKCMDCKYFIVPEERH